MRADYFRIIKWLLALMLVAVAKGETTVTPKTRNVFLIISDGLRWQEIFNGAEEMLLTKEQGGVQNPRACRAQFWRDTPEARREVLFPFLWGKIGRHGQIFGNLNQGSKVTVTNGKNFSYPGYNEILTGFGDPRIDSNDKKPNPNVSVFEWLNQQPPLRGRVAVFGTWDLFPYIFNCERSRLPVWPAWEKRFAAMEIPPPTGVAEMRRDTTPMWEDLTYDSFLFHAARDYVQHHHPRLLFIGFGETDEWGHDGRYDHYLTAANHVDRFIQGLWEMVQSLPSYRGTTTFIITADHGRGRGEKEWKDHGEKVAGAEEDWIAVLGPDTAPLGERQQTVPLTESQIAGTMAALLGKDYLTFFPNAGAPITEVLGNVAKRNLSPKTR